MNTASEASQMLRARPCAFLLAHGPETSDINPPCSWGAKPKGPRLFFLWNFAGPATVSPPISEDLFMYNPFRLAPALALFLSALVSVSSCRAQDSGGIKLDLHANAKASAKDIGLPLYPRATPYKEGDSDSSTANLGFAFNDFHFGLLVASYITPDSPAQVLDFYRKPLAHYGEVLECDHGKPVGALTVTHSGLTCSGSKGDHLQANGSPDSSTDHELRAGTPLHYRIVGIGEFASGKTRFGLVNLELPKDSDSSR